MNYFIASYIVIVIFLSLTGLFGSLFYQNLYTGHWYLVAYAPTNVSLSNFITFISFIQLTNIIPMSLYVTLELIKSIGSNFFQWDKEYVYLKIILYIFK